MGELEMMVKMGAAIGAMVAAAGLIFFSIAKILGIKRRDPESAPAPQPQACPAPEFLARHEQHSSQLGQEILRFQEREATQRREEHARLVSIMEKQTQLMTRLVTIQELRGSSDRSSGRFPE
jgi:hypothetical protein